MAWDSQEIFYFQSYSFGRAQTYFYFGETSHHTIGSNSCPISFSQRLSEVGSWLKKPPILLDHSMLYITLNDISYGKIDPRGSDKADPQIKYWSKWSRGISCFSAYHLFTKNISIENFHFQSRRICFHWFSVICDHLICNNMNIYFQYIPMYTF